MRVYANCYELMSEIFREVYEMGQICHPYSMQNIVVKNNPDFDTKEITNYSYCLLNMFKAEYLFWAEPEALLWADEEFKERVSPIKLNPGNAWKLRRHIWEPFLNEEGEFDYTYNDRIRKQLRYVIQELKDHPDTRQAVISIWDPSIDVRNLGGKRRVPCSITYKFYYRKGRLDIVYDQRSADAVVHFGNDVYLAWKMMEYVADRLGYKKGYLYHNIGSLHAYRKDWDKLKQCIEDIKIK